MKLYSIRHKVSGKFLVNVHPAGGECWTKKRPHFWSTPDGIVSNLKKISGERVAEGDSFNEWWKGAKDADTRANGYNVYWRNPDPAKLKNIEVIVTNVSVLSDESFPASHFFDAEELIS